MNILIYCSEGVYQVDQITEAIVSGLGTMTEAKKHSLYICGRGISKAIIMAWLKGPNCPDMLKGVNAAVVPYEQVFRVVKGALFIYATLTDEVIHIKSLVSKYGARTYSYRVQPIASGKKINYELRSGERKEGYTK